MYSRGYGCLVTVQELAELEEIVQYKSTIATSGAAASTSLGSQPHALSHLATSTVTATAAVTQRQLHQQQQAVRTHLV